MANNKMIISMMMILILISTSGCVEFISNWPEPQILSEKDRRAYSGIEIKDLIKSPSTFENNNVFLRGRVEWIKEEKVSDETVTSMIINVDEFDSFIGESVSVKYRGRLPGIYEKSEINIYGIVKGTETAYNSFGATREIPNIYAVEIINPNIPYTTTHVPTNSESIEQYIPLEKSFKDPDKRSIIVGNTLQINDELSISANSINIESSPRKASITVYLNKKTVFDGELNEGDYTNIEKYSIKLDSVFKEKNISSIQIVLDELVRLWDINKEWSMNIRDIDYTSSPRKLTITLIYNNTIVVEKIMKEGDIIRYEDIFSIKLKSISKDGNVSFSDLVVK